MCFVYPDLLLIRGKEFFKGEGVHVFCVSRSLVPWLGARNFVVKKIKCPAPPFKKRGGGGGLGSGCACVLCIQISY